MMANEPLILTARVADKDLEPFNALRKQHFPQERNFLSAHLTMFHHLPGQHVEEIKNVLASAVDDTDGAINVDVVGLRHLGAGVAFSLASPELQDIRVRLRDHFRPWLKPQDLQKWQPHITIQNKVSQVVAGRLYARLDQGFRPHSIAVTGLDLWSYLGGPWRFETSVIFGSARS
jgi:hypothetical protein